MGSALSRRHLLGAASAGLVAAVAGSSKALAGPLGLPGAIADPMRALLPGDAGGALNLIGELLALEQEAKALRLPRSALSFGIGDIPADPARLYELVMPRLVALVDRSELRSPGLAEKAGGLLARLHRTQYAAPAAWAGLAGQPAAPIALPLTPGADDVPDLVRGVIELPAQALPAPETMLPPIARSRQFGILADEYAAWFAAVVLRPEHQESADWHLTMMRASRARYAAVGDPLGVPWQFIAAVHGLEASFNFRAHLHNGDFPLSQRTRQVPPGRPLVWLPPSSWEASASDALKLMGYARQQDWSVPRMLYRLEAYNGFGYRSSGRATPYLWSFSNLYSTGKFVADGRFEPKARSQQCGAAVMLKLLDRAGELGR